MNNQDQQSAGTQWNMPKATNWDDDDQSLKGKVGDTTVYSGSKGDGSVTTPTPGSENDIQSSPY